MSLSRIVQRIYKCKVNTDLVICGVLLHDIFKPATYTQREGAYGRSALAERVDHLTLASAELIRRGFPLDAVHVVTASHGQQYGPIGPMTIEALICHLGDYAEAKLNGDVLNAARFMVREVMGEEPQTLSGKEAFAIVRTKTDKGWDGLKEYLTTARPCRLSHNVVGLFESLSLGSEVWHSVIRAIEEAIPEYDFVNEKVTFRSRPEASATMP